MSCKRTICWIVEKFQTTGSLLSGVQWMQVKSENPCFEKRYSATGLRPSGSPDSNLWWLLYGACIVHTVYMNSTHESQELKENIWRQTAYVSRQELCHVWKNIFRSFQACLEARVPHFETLLWHKASWGKTHSKFPPDAGFVRAKTVSATAVAPRQKIKDTICIKMNFKEILRHRVDWIHSLKLGRSGKHLLAS